MRTRSHSARSAWIETTRYVLDYAAAICRTPQGVRGLKPIMIIYIDANTRRTPQGVRGLKRFILSIWRSGWWVALRKECVD